MKDQVSISVIIAARNEEMNIRNCLHSIIGQSYPKGLFEVIVVDDFSTDDTSTIVNEFEQNQVSLILLKDHVGETRINSYKKKAIEIAIEKASGELIVTTDADCIAPKRWLETIANFYNLEKPAIIAAPVSYRMEKSFLSIFQSLDFMTLQGITGASIFKNFHAMCNGANLVYQKNAFYEVGGFEGIDDIASGDDMLLMNKISRLYPGRVKYLPSPLAIVETKPVHTVREFLQQRIRWASKTSNYKDKKIIAVLVLVYLFNCFILIIGIISLFHPSMSFSLILILLIKIIGELFFLYPVASFYKRKNLLWWFPLAQPFHILYIVLAGALGSFGSYEWKGRNVK